MNEGFIQLIYRDRSHHMNHYQMIAQMSDGPNSVHVLSYPHLLHKFMNEHKNECNQYKVSDGKR